MSKFWFTIGMVKQHLIDCRDVTFCLLDGCKYEIEQHDNQYLIWEKRNDKDKECREYNPRESIKRGTLPYRCLWIKHSFTPPPFLCS